MKRRDHRKTPPPRLRALRERSELATVSGGIAPPTLPQPSGTTPHDS